MERDCLLTYALMPRHAPVDAAYVTCCTLSPALPIVMVGFSSGVVCAVRLTLQSTSSGTGPNRMSLNGSASGNRASRHASSSKAGSLLTQLGAASTQSSDQPQENTAHVIWSAKLHAAACIKVQ